MRPRLSRKARCRDGIATSDCRRNVDKGVELRDARCRTEQVSVYNLSGSCARMRLYMCVYACDMRVSARETVCVPDAEQVSVRMPL